MNFKNRIAHATRRNTGKKTIYGRSIYKGIRGGLFTRNGTPVYNHGNGFYSTNKYFNATAHMNMLQPRQH